MAIVSPTVTTQGGVTTTTAASTPKAGDRYNLLDINAKRAYNTYITANNLSSSLGGEAGNALRNKWLDNFLAQYKDPNAPAKATDPLSTLLPSDQTTSLLSSGENTDALAQKDAQAQADASLFQNAPVAPAADTPAAKADVAPVTPPEQKKQESLGNVNVPTQNYVLGNTPNNNLPSNVNPSPSVPTKSDTNNSDAVKAAARARRGRASTIGLGRRSANTELSSNIVKLLGV